MIKAVEHIAVMATDAERTAQFYQEMLGFQDAGSLEVPGAGKLVFVEFDGVKLELFSGGKAPGEPHWGSDRIGYMHLCLLVDDVIAETERLKALGVEFIANPNDVAGLRVSFLKDPDGNVIELFQRLS